MIEFIRPAVQHLGVTPADLIYSSKRDVCAEVEARGSSMSQGLSRCRHPNCDQMIQVRQFKKPIWKVADFAGLVDAGDRVRRFETLDEPMDRSVQANPMAFRDERKLGERWSHVRPQEVKFPALNVDDH